MTADLMVAESPPVPPVRELEPELAVEPETELTELQASAESEPQAEVSPVRELEPELAAELELEPTAGPQLSRSRNQRRCKSQSSIQSRNLSRSHIIMWSSSPSRRQQQSRRKQCLTGLSRRLCSGHLPEQTLTPAATAAVQAAFTQDETDGYDLIALDARRNARRLEKMLARQGCDDADTVAQAVLAARDAIPKKATMLAQHGELDSEICFERYCSAEQRMPRMLPRGHTFCESCLDYMTSSAPSPKKGKQQTIGCPACRTPAEVPKGGVWHLLKNYLVDSMADAASKLGA